MRTTPLCLTYLAAIAAAEALAAVVGPLWGVAFHFIILFLIISNSALVGKNPSYRLLLALGLAPLIRILGLSMPLLEFSQIYWYLFISIPLVAGIFTVIRALDLSPQEVGLTRGSILVQGLIALTGIIFGLVEYYILKPEPLILSLGWQELVVPALILLVATGFVEELAFRGVMQQALERLLGSWGWVYVAVLFTVLQIGHLSAVHCLFVFLVALFFGVVVKRTGSIMGVSLSHGLLNIGLYLIFPFVL